MTGYDLNRTEQALLIMLGMVTLSKIGQLAVDHRYPQLTEGQLTLLREKVERVLAGTIASLRAPGPTPVPDELAQVSDEVAAGCVRSILGDPPGYPPKLGLVH